MNDIALHVDDSSRASLHIQSDTQKALSVDGQFYNIGVPEYRGSCLIEPSESEIVMAVEGMKMPHDVVISPIPSNYGLITWDGSTITVS